MIIIDEENDEYKDLAVLYHGDYSSSETDRRYYQMGFYTTEKVSYKSSQIQAIVQAFEKNDGDPIYFDLNKSYRGGRGKRVPANPGSEHGHYPGKW